MLRLAIIPLLCATLAFAAAESAYMGPEACAKCHPSEYQKQIHSHHAQALRPIGQSAVYAILGDSRLNESGFSLSYSPKNGMMEVTVEGASGKASGTLEWAFGAGAQGITPVGTNHGRYFEHRLSYYTGARRLAPTFGHPKSVMATEAELGIPQDGNTISKCFGCHATGVQPGSTSPDLSTMRPGVTCERCHGPGRAHVAAAAAGAAKNVVRRAVLNPGRFPAKAQVEMCGECHRLPTPDNTSPEPEIEDPVSVRFAPIGLMASQCFIKSKLLSCRTCHDPHEDARPRSDAMYSERCVGCHSASVPVHSSCPRQKDRNCVSCHMHRAALGPYLRFTDHRIRVPYRSSTAEMKPVAVIRLTDP